MIGFNILTSPIRKRLRWFRCDRLALLLRVLLLGSLAYLEVLGGRINSAVGVGLVSQVNFTTVPTCSSPFFLDRSVRKAGVIGFDIPEPVIVAKNNFYFGELISSELHSGKFWQSEHHEIGCSNSNGRTRASDIIPPGYKYLTSLYLFVVDGAEVFYLGGGTPFVFIFDEKSPVGCGPWKSVNSQKRSLLSDILDVSFPESVVHHNELLLGDPGIIRSSAESESGNKQHPPLHAKPLLLKGIIAIAIRLALARLCIPKFCDGVDRKDWPWEIMFGVAAIIGAYGVFVLMEWSAESPLDSLQNTNQLLEKPNVDRVQWLNLYSFASDRLTSS